MKSRRIGFGAGCARVVCLLLLALSTGAFAQNSRVAFVSLISGNWQLCTIKPDGTGFFQVTNLPSTPDDGWLPSISPDGQRIVFNFNTGNGPDLYVVNIDGTNLQQLTNDQSSFWARWSPDGKTLVFTTFAGLPAAVIATMAADGSGQRTYLTPAIWDSVGAYFTPDGKQIVFGSSLGGFVSAAWIMNADGSHRRRLTQAVVKAQPWGISPDGKHILAYSNQDTPPFYRSDVIVMNLDGSQLKHLGVPPQFHHDLYPSYSPDGKKIAFISDRFATDITQFTYGTFDLFTMNPDGSDVTDVLPAIASCPFDGNCAQPLWGPSGSK